MTSSMRVSAGLLAIAFLLSLPQTAKAVSVYNADFTGFQPSDSQWTITRGEWKGLNGELVNNFGGDNRLFISDLTAGQNYNVSVNATIKDGDGWAIFFDGSLDTQNRFSGYSLQYDPGISNSGAILLRSWNHDTEKMLVTQAFPAGLDVFGVAHELTLLRTEDAVTAYLDGQELFTKTLATDAGGIIGLRTWATKSGNDIFHTFSASGDISGSAVVSSVPEPLTMLSVFCATGALGGYMLRRLKKTSLPC